MNWQLTAFYLCPRPRYLASSQGIWAQMSVLTFYAPIAVSFCVCEAVVSSLTPCLLPHQLANLQMKANDHDLHITSVLILELSGLRPESKRKRRSISGERWSNDIRYTWRILLNWEKNPKQTRGCKLQTGKTGTDLQSRLKYFASHNSGCGSWINLDHQSHHLHPMPNSTA